jgi:excinuclease UvrABC ATPase subunit
MLKHAIRIRGARTNNLKSLDVDIPRGRLTVFVGLSGSGKSSLLFDTIAAEARHQLNETFPPFVRNRLPKWARPEVEDIAGISPVVLIDQRRIGGNARSTVGTITDAWTYLRLLFSRIGSPHVGESNHFSFNDPAGMCPTCSGLGEVVVSAVERFLDLDRSLAQGAILLPGFGNGGYWYAHYAGIGSFEPSTPLRDWTEEQRQALLYGGEHAARLGGGFPKDYEGVVERFERIYLHTSDNLSDRKRETIARFTRSETCPDCHGDRLNEAARTATVLGRTIGEMARMEITELAGHLAHVTDPAVAPVVAALGARLEAMTTIGLGYLHLGRATTTLSGGESQRIKTVKHLGSSLIEMLYIFDEPTVGLHPHDIASMITLLRQLRDKGNTILVVEHDPAVMAIADKIIEIGPGAGADGGELVFQGTFAELRTARTATSAALRDRTRITTAPRTATGAITVANATRNNLKNLTVDIPAGVLTVLTGVAGSGKSTLAAELVAQHHAVVIDQRPVSVNRRSTPISYTGIAASVRRLFAKHSGLSPGMFSANSEGGCPDCKGLGVIYTDLAFMDGQETVCETCKGRRFTDAVLRHRVNGAVHRGRRRPDHHRRDRASAGQADPRSAASSRPGRTRLPPPRPAAHHTVRRGMPAPQDSQGTARRRGAGPVRPRRTHHGPAPARHRHLARRPRSTPRPWPHRRRDRAQRRRRPARGLDHRPWPGSRQARRPGPLPRTGRPVGRHRHRRRPARRAGFDTRDSVSW